jgi:hypothetical protein
MMEKVFEFLNQPIVLTIVSLVIGSYLLNLIAERRSRRDTLKDQAIEFINDVAEHTNAFVVAIFGKLRPNRIELDETLRKAISDLYSGRMSIEIGSRAYLKSEDFYQQYFHLLDEFGEVMGTFMRVDQGAPHEEMITRVQTKYTKLEKSWPLAGEIHTEDPEALVDHLIIWMEMLSHRVTDLLTRHLNKVMRS